MHEQVLALSETLPTRLTRLLLSYSLLLDRNPRTRRRTTGRGLSLHPVQDVAQHRPARRLRRAVLPEDPVREQLIDRAVPAFQLDPGIDHRRHGTVAAGNRVRQRYLER